jgi:hypothetical protein
MEGMTNLELRMTNVEWGGETSNVEESAEEWGRNKKAA